MKRLTIYITIGLLLLAALAGCKAGGTGANTNEGRAFATITDDNGRLVTIPTKPARIVVLSPTYLELLYSVGGSAVGRSTSRVGSIPEQALKLPEVGFAYNVNVEKLLALQPDLVIAVQGVNEKLLPVLESSKVPVLMLRLKSIEDLKAKTQMLGDIAGNPAQAAALVSKLESNIQSIKKHLPDKPKKIAILHASAKSVTLELENSLTGSAASELRLINIASGSNPLEGDPDAAPYSLEKLVEADPDIVFFTLMGNPAELEQRMRQDISGNPAWASVRAIRENKYYFLPPSLFLVHPALRYDQAVEYLARLVYPEVFTHGK